MKLTSACTTFALSVLLQSSSTVASLHQPQQLLDHHELAHDQDQNVQTLINTHRSINEELVADTANSDSLIQFLESDDCAYLIESINDATEQFLNDNNDDEIINKLCSDEEAGQLLRKEAKMEKGLDPDAPFIMLQSDSVTCESVLDALLVQQKDTLLGIISDADVCKTEVQRELDTFKEEDEDDKEGGLRRRRTLRGGRSSSSAVRRLPRYIIINKPKAASDLGFIRRAMIIQKPTNN